MNEKLWEIYCLSRTFANYGKTFDATKFTKLICEELISRIKKDLFSKEDIMNEYDDERSKQMVSHNEGVNNSIASINDFMKFIEQQ